MPPPMPLAMCGDGGSSRVSYENARLSLLAMPVIILPDCASNGTQRPTIKPNLVAFISAPDDSRLKLLDRLEVGEPDLTGGASGRWSVPKTGEDRQQQNCGHHDSHRNWNANAPAEQPAPPRQAAIAGEEFFFEAQGSGRRP